MAFNSIPISYIVSVFVADIGTSGLITFMTLQLANILGIPRGNLVFWSHESNYSLRAVRPCVFLGRFWLSHQGSSRSSPSLECSSGGSPTMVSLSSYLRGLLQQNNYHE
jgi:hypothetical protein